MKPIQEKITNETAYRNHLHKLNEENVKLKKEVRMLKEALTKAENLPISDVRLSLLEQAKDCLTELCQLKAYKDDMGKDNHYQKRQPELWKEANRLLNELSSEA